MENQRLKFYLFGNKFLNLKQYCKKQPVDVYKIFNLKQKNKSNVILDFAFELMEQLNVNQICYKDFSTTTLSDGVVCSTLFNKTVFEIFSEYNLKNENALIK